MKKLREMLQRLLEHPVVQILVAVSLVGTSANEIFAPFLDAAADGGIHSGHGLFLFGLVHAGRSLFDLVENLEKLPDGSAEEK